MIKVLLVDDHTMVRRGLRMRLGLEPDVEIVGEARDGREALSLVQSLAPDVVVMDVALTDLDGIAITRRICELAPRTAVVMLSLYGDRATQAHAREAGAAAFVEKRAGAGDLLVEIRRAASSANGLRPRSEGSSGPKQGSRIRPLPDEGRSEIGYTEGDHTKVWTEAVIGE